MSQLRYRLYSIVLFTAALLSVPALQAGGPLYVTGINADSQGEPYLWKMNPILYSTDLGGLGNQSNEQANALVADALQTWQNVATTNISMQRTGSLPYDVTSGNIITFLNSIGNCSDSSQPTISMIYDVDGSILTDLGIDQNSTLGFTGIACTNDATGEFSRGFTIFNGSFIDGKAQSSTHNTVTLAQYKTTFIHEFGHLLGLDHSQINLNCYTDTACSAADLAGVPIMFPILLDGITSTLRADDISAISTLYPGSSFASTTGHIQGRVFFADGITPAQGYNVIARLVGNPRTTAYSCVSGYLFTSGAGNIYAPNYADTVYFFGSRDPSLIGYFDIAGLTPGQYTLEVEAIYNDGSIPFVGDSSVGPIGADLGFQFKIPGTCALQYLNYPSSPSDSCSAYTTIQVNAGTIVNTNTDIILLGTPPRYDAWEDGD